MSFTVRHIFQAEYCHFNEQEKRKPVRRAWVSKDRQSSDVVYTGIEKVDMGFIYAKFKREISWCILHPKRVIFTQQKWKQNNSHWIKANTSSIIL